MSKRARVKIWALLENIPAVLTVAFSAYVLVQSQTSDLEEMEVLNWLLGIVGLLATSELIERFRAIRRIESATDKTLTLVRGIDAAVSQSGDLLRGLTQAADLSEGAAHAREIQACGYSLANLVSRYEGFLADRCRDGCTLKFLVMDPAGAATQALDALVSVRPGELVADLESVLARLSRVADQPNTTSGGSVEIRLLKTAPTCSLIIVDPGEQDGYVHVELYPSYQGLPYAGRPHFLLTDSHNCWYQFYCNQFSQMWNDQSYAEPYQMSP